MTVHLADGTTLGSTLNGWISPVPALAHAEVYRRAQLRPDFAVSPFDALCAAREEYIEDCRGRMRGRDLLRLQDSFECVVVEYPAAPSPRCPICGAAPANGWAGAALGESLCAPCALWALGFDRWDHEIECRRADTQRGMDPSVAICPPA